MLNTVVHPNIRPVLVDGIMERTDPLVLSDPATLNAARHQLQLAHWHKSHHQQREKDKDGRLVIDE